MVWQLIVNLHFVRQLLVTVVRATFRFHDTTPQGKWYTISIFKSSPDSETQGRMTNRFGKVRFNFQSLMISDGVRFWKDMATIDSSLAGSLQSVNSSLASFFAAIITVALVWFYFQLGKSSNKGVPDSVVFPYFLVAAFFIGFAYYELAIGYLNTGRDLRRMESNTRSPIFSDFGEVLEGIVTVRAFSAEKRFLNNVFVKIDVTTKVGFFHSMSFSSSYLSLVFPDVV